MIVVYNPEYVCPKKESFHFGMWTCASCLGHINSQRDRLSKFVWPPVYADHAKTEVIIPAGRQSFHRECFEKLNEAL